MTPEVNGDEKLVGGITYLASLVSNPLAIDVKLDTLRTITARYGPNATLTLTDEDRRELGTVQSEIEEYLITNDPVRSFTKASLQQKLDHYLAAQDPKAQARQTTTKQLVGILGLALVLYSLVIILARGALLTKVMLAAPLFIAVLHAGLAWLFLSARKDLVSELRKAYGYISAGLLVAVLGSPQFPILFAYPELTHWPIFRYAGFMPPFAVMYLLFYIGLYVYAKQVSAIRWRFLKPSWATAGGLAISLLVIIVPHAVRVPEEAFFDLSLVATAMSGWFSALAALLGFAILRHVTDRYAQGMRLFAGAQVVVVLGCCIFFAMIFLSGPASGVKVAASALPFIISEALMLAAAYRFKKNATE
jgi:hypothetical protein